MGNRKGTERSGAEGEKRKEGNWAVDRGRGQSREKEGKQGTGQRGDGEEGDLLHCCWECKLLRATMETIWRFLQKLKTGLPIRSSNLILGH